MHDVDSVKSTSSVDRRRRQFCLSTLLGLVTLVCLALGAWRSLGWLVLVAVIMLMAYVTAALVLGSLAYGVGIVCRSFWDWYDRGRRELDDDRE